MENEYGDLVKAELQLMEQRQDRLMNHPKIKPLINTVSQWVEKTQGRPISMHEKRNVAMCMYNTISDHASRKGRLMEATTEDSIEFLGVQLPIIAAMIPTLVLNEVATVQALDRRVGAVFYIDVQAASARGEVAAGDDLLNAQTGHTEARAGRRYAVARVSGETLGTGDGTYNGTTLVNPGLINRQNNVLEAKVGTTYTTIATCDADGNWTGANGVTVSGTLTAAGVYNITVTGAASAATILISYDYQYDLPKDANGDRDGVAKMKIAMRQEAVIAKDYPLRAEWSLGAQIDLQKAHGMDLERELVKYLGSEIKFTIDQEGLDRIDEAAKSANSAGTITTWDGRPSEGESWMEKRFEFLDRFQEANNLIIDKTKRGYATFAVCGNDVARVLKQLGKDYFKADPNLKKSQSGPFKIGTLNDTITCIQNPFKTATDYTVGFRGDQFMMAGFVYAPYIPLFSTPTLTTSDLMSQKGFMSAAAFKTVNAGMFCSGSVQNIASGYVKGT